MESLQFYVTEIRGGAEAFLRSPSRRPQARPLSSALRQAARALALAPFLGLLPSCGRPPPPGAPPVILFSIDTLRADHLGCSGYPRPTSPFIDEFCRECVFFENAVSQSHYTSPSHMSIFTGLTPFVHQVDNTMPGQTTITKMADGIPTLIEDLHNHGYLTIGIHGGANVDQQFGFGRGFDSYVPEFYTWEKDQQADPRRLKTIKKLVRKWIRKSRKGGKPLFLFLHHYLCHDPYLEGPESIRFRFVEEKIEGLPARPEDLGETDEYWAVSKRFWDKVNLAEPSHRKYAIGLYDGGVYYSDRVFGEFLDLLRDEGIYDDAFVILLSDHGEEFYEHGGKAHENLFIENLHVPLMIKFPHGRWGGKVVRRRVRTMDVLPSIFEYLRLPLSHPIQGTSFLPLITGTGSYDPAVLSFAFARPPHHEDSVCIFFDPYTYTNFRWRGVPDWLFDQRNDPRQQENLAGLEPELVAAMRAEAEEITAINAEFRSRLAPPAPAEPAQIDPELLDQLKALGYIN